MKKLTLIALSAALLGGMSVASAQNAPTTKHIDSPANINEGSPAGSTSGAESQNAAKGARGYIAGTGKFCTQMSGGKLDCRFASLQSCKSATKSGNFKCVLNPKTGTTGSK